MVHNRQPMGKGFAMNVPRNVEFPEFTNAGINAALTADKLNEVLVFLRTKFPEQKSENIFLDKRVLKSGVKEVPTPRGPRYFLNSRMIKTSEAFE